MADMQVPVLIVGGGPVGLLLAAELGWRGIRCLLVERNPDINNHPRANVVAARSMEHFRRLGIAEAVIDAGLPRDYPVNIIFTRRIAGDEIFRFSFPSVAAAAEPPPELLAAMPELVQSPYYKTSVGQNHLEPVLRDCAAAQPGVELRFGWRLEGFRQSTDAVSADLTEVATGRRQTVRASYLAACDGGRSAVRAALGVELEGRPGLGHFVGIYFRSHDFGRGHDLGRGTLYWSLNAERTGIFIAIDGRDHFTLQCALRPGQSAEGLNPGEALVATYGRPFDFEIISTQPWTAHQLVAARYRAGRVFLAGDAAHLFVPTGGFGMNTGIGDAVDLAWKLSAVLEGWGDPDLLDSYELERQPIGRRNTAEAADNYEKMLPVFAQAAIYDSGGGQDACLRERIIAELQDSRKHFSATGVHLGYRYEGSPICIADDTPEPPDDPQVYVPNARPGARAPHVWLAPGRTILDLFGRGFVLLRFDRACDVDSLRAAAHARYLPLTVADVDLDAARALYAQRLVLVRPDGHVAWRGDEVPRDAVGLIDRIRGAASARPAAGRLTAEA